MNASNSILPLAALGQPLSILTEAELGKGDDTTFVDSLTASMATAATPVSHQPIAAVAGADSTSIEGLRRLTVPNDIAGIDLDVSVKGLAVHDAVLANSLRHADVMVGAAHTIDANGFNVEAGIETSAFKTSAPEASAAPNSSASIVSSAGTTRDDHQLAHPSHRMPSSAMPSSGQSDHVQHSNQPIVEIGDRPVVDALHNSLDRPPVTEPGQRSQALAGRSMHPVAALAPSALPPLPAPLADTILDSDAGQKFGPFPLINSAKQTEPSTLSAVAARAAVVESRPRAATADPVSVTPSDRPIRLGNGGQAPAASINEVDGAAYARSAVNPSKGVPAFAEHGSDTRRAVPASAVQTIPIVEAKHSAAPSPQTARPRNDRPAVSSPGQALESGDKPVQVTALASGTVQTLTVEASPPQGGAFNGFDRYQPVLPVDGVAYEIERFEPAASSALSRAQTQTGHLPAGAQVALQIVRSMPEGVDRFSVQLHPAELGSVEIQLDFEGAGRVRAVITAERPETLELLQRDSRLLERSLGDSGVKLASDGLSFALRQDQQQQQHGQSFHDQAQARQAAFRAGRAYDDASDTEQIPSTVRVEGLRLLDIKT